MNAAYWKKIKVNEVPGGYAVPDDEFLRHVPKNGTILDIGCGNANITIYLAKLGFHVTGIDLSSAVIEKNQQLQLNNATFLVHDLQTKLPFDDQQFDAIVGAYILVNILPSRARKNVVKELTRILKTNGVIWIHEGLVSEKYQQRYLLCEGLVKEKYDFYSFKDKNTAGRIKSQEDLQKVITSGEIERVIHHFTSEELDSLFCDYKCVSRRKEDLQLKRGGNPLESIIATYKLKHN